MSDPSPRVNRRQPPVAMYSKWGCGSCMWARRLFRARGIEWEEIPVTFRPLRFREMVERSGGRTTAPQIFIGDVHVGGFAELVELDANGRLRELLETDALLASSENL